MSDLDADVTALRGKVLHIEDEQVNHELVAAILTGYAGVTVLHAKTGTEGIRLALAERPELILLDMHLPDIGGLDVVRALNELIHSHPMRVILLTADDFSIDVVKAMSLGAHDYWRKPVRIEQFRAGIVKALGPG
jgi:DNA-binding response OmpR family regulator